MFIEVLNLVNLPYRQIIKLLHMQNLLIFTYMASAVLLQGRFGFRHEIKQIILSTEIGIFEYSRKNCIKKLSLQLGQSTDSFVNQIGSRLNDSEKIIFYLNNLHQRDFLVFYKSYINNNLQNENFDVLNCGLKVSNILISKGYFSIAEQVEIHTKTSYDNKLARGAGLRNESSYLTAVGHITLMGYLVMAKKVGMTASKPIEILLSEEKISNRLFANIIIQEARNVGIVVRPSLDSIPSESDLELFPNEFNSYDIARYLYSEIFRSYEEKNSQPFLNLKDLDPSIACLGRDVLNRNGVIDHSQLVGFHVREDQDFSRSNRNSKFIKYLKSLAWLEKQGYTVIRLGKGAKKSNSKIGKASLDISSLELNSEEREAVNIFVWANSKFFIGNLSGGTFPPSLFGTPTIYTDVFPYTHFTIPGLVDAVLPKKLYCLNSQKFLTLDEAFSQKFTNIQIEDPLQLALHGYRLVGRTSDDILKAIILFEGKLHTGYSSSLLPKTKDLNDPSFRLSEFKRRLLIH